MFIARHYMYPVNMLFIAAALYLGVDAFYKVLISRMDYEEVPAAEVRSSAESPAETVIHPLSYYKDIETRNLFKTKEEEKEAVPTSSVPAAEQLQETGLKLKLWGTVTGDADRAYAVIEESKQRKQSLYHIGDTVEGAVVKQILREKIIITFNGKDETLSMESLTGKAVAKGPDQPPDMPMPFPFPGIGAAEVPPGESQKIALERAQIEEAVNDVNNLMKQAKIRPHFKDGQPDGLTLSRIQRDSIFSKLGLRSGDIITGVDGQKIQSVDDALKFYNSLKSSSNVSVEIKRRGKTEQIEYNIE
ncbi:MAG: type II secretion system protein GspC [Desulfococcaceae bacterium]